MYDEINKGGSKEEQDRWCLLVKDIDFVGRSEAETP
jgi:hypothetical protein